MPLNKMFPLCSQLTYLKVVLGYASYVLLSLYHVLQFG